MYCPISIDDFINKKTDTSSKKEKKIMRESILQAVKDKKNNIKCSNCGDVIWAIGSGIVGWNACFSCITGEADNSNDYEIDEVCY